MTTRKRLRRKRQKSASTIVLRVAVVLVVVFVVVAVAGIAAATDQVNLWLRGLPDYTNPTAFEIAQPTKIYSADGKLLAKMYLQNREVVPLSQMASSVTSGVVAVEDERYFQHGGVDPVGILRAMFTTANGDRQGASTITQQYVRNTLLLDERTQMTLERKVREAYLAMQIEKMYSKQQILENYLNTVYFGEGAYGVEAAARTYFAKSANQLTLPEGALIAGLVQSPSRLDPYTNPSAAITRRNVVLNRMLYNHYITRADYDQAIIAPLVLKRENQPTNGIYADPYYVSYVEKLLQQQFSQGVVFNGGLTVFTTLDTRIQADADKAANRYYSRKGYPSVALVSIDPRSGYVKAMVGGKDFTKSKFNLATQGHRQPGSSFKAFVLVTALSQGMPPYYEVDSNAPVTIPSKPHPWVVSNDEGQGSGMMSLDEATWNSVNAVFARVAWAVGIKNVAHTAEDMGITTHLPSYPSIALGSVGCTPLEMASAYGTLATDGVHHDPIAITKVLDNTGKVIYQADPNGTQVIKPQIAYATTKVLEGVISQGTATAADIGRPEAGKTGTSQNNRDCWFIGYTPQLVTSVWVGYPTEKTIVINGSKGFGGTVAAPIWAAFMRQALAGQPARDFQDQPTPRYDESNFDIPVSSATRYAEEQQRQQSQSNNGNSGGSNSGGNDTGSKAGGKSKSSGNGSGGNGSGGGGTGTGGSGNTTGTP